jgi:hypothetical protein
LWVSIAFIAGVSSKFLVTWESGNREVPCRGRCGASFGMTTCEGTATATAKTTATATTIATTTATTTATDARLRRPLQVEDGKRDAMSGSRCTPLAFGAGLLLLGLFGANFAEEFFTAKFAFFLDDDFAEVGPGGF